MRTGERAARLMALLLLGVVWTGCESLDEGSRSGDVYYGSGFYDPWYYGSYYEDPGVITRPPGAHPEHPIAGPPPVGPRPTPMPSIPSRPMPRMR